MLFKTHVRKFAHWMKRLNSFKVADDRTENSIKQQKIITRVYLILLTGMITFTAHISDIDKDRYITVRQL